MTDAEKRRGRPRLYNGEHVEHMGITAYPSQIEEIRRIAEDRGCGVSVVVREAIMLYLQNQS